MKTQKEKEKIKGSLQIVEEAIDDIMKNNLDLENPLHRVGVLASAATHFLAFSSALICGKNKEGYEAFIQCVCRNSLEVYPLICEKIEALLKESIGEADYEDVISGKVDLRVVVKELKKRVKNG